MTSVLVTGVAGFIGSHVARALLGRGETVIGVDNFSDYYDPVLKFARLKPLLEDPSILKVAQNGKYDLAVLARYGIEVGPIEDTMLISFALEGGLHKSHGMDELSRRLLGHEPISFKTV
eukprot:gene41728-65863_t